MVILIIYFRKLCEKAHAKSREMFEILFYLVHFRVMIVIYLFIYLLAVNISLGHRRTWIPFGRGQWIKNIRSEEKISLFTRNLNNRPRSIYQYSNMEARRSGKNCKFAKCLLSFTFQKRLTWMV